MQTDLSPSVPYVFVSYARADRDRVAPIVHRIEAAGIAVWGDDRGETDAETWHPGATHAILGCAVFALMSSHAAMASPAVRRELELAWVDERAYLTLMLDAVRLPPEIRHLVGGWPSVDVLGHPDSMWWPKLERALSRLGVAVGAPTAATSMPVGADTRGHARALAATLVAATLPTPPQAHGLTPRELDVLRLLAGGLTNNDIADQLVLSVRTVERHIETIYGKIGAHGKAARAVAARYALLHGID